MTIEEAIAELKEDIDLYIPTNGTIEEVDRELPDGRLITALEMAIKALEKQKTGKWQAVFSDDRGYTDTFRCSCCNHFTVMKSHLQYCDFDFCPWCGARMEAESEGKE